MRKIENLSDLEEDMNDIYWLKYKLLKDHSYSTVKEFLEKGYIKTILNYLEEENSKQENDENDEEEEEEEEEEGEENDSFTIIDNMLCFLLEV